MKTEEIILPDGKKANIWKLNYGFKSDMQGAVSKITNKGEDLEINVGNVQLMTLVYGIWDSADLFIEAPKDLELGLSTEEINLRLKKIRGLESGGDLLYKEINRLNKEVGEDTLKK